MGRELRAFFSCMAWRAIPGPLSTWVQSQGWEDPLEEGMVAHSSSPAWRIPMDRGAWWASEAPWEVP